PILDPESITIRTADEDDASTIHALIVQHLVEGHLLPRELGEVSSHAHRFVIALHEGQVVGCAELAPLSASVAEVRSLAIRREARSLGLGRRIIDVLVDRALEAGYSRLCAFTHSPGYFVRLGFSIVPHAWLPEKIGSDCQSCSHFRRCGQYAVVRALAHGPRQSIARVASHG